uniref:Unspecific monooxygenase n=1 Tax=Angiostrongylus cantonensis TaxID=6313 RepID=A0A0K0DB01_ANGCA
LGISFSLNSCIRKFQEYGSVHTFWFGPIASVNICDYSTAVDAMVKKGSTFADRISPYLFTLIRNNRGIIASNGPAWLEQRRFALHTLRNFGLGRNIIEERIMFECVDLEKRLKTGETSIDPFNMFELLVGNIINRILFTDRFEKVGNLQDEKLFTSIDSKAHETTENFTTFDMLIDEFNVNLKRDIEHGTHVLEGEGGDFVDAFLIQMKKDKDSNISTSFDEEMLLMSLLDLWMAGQETTTVTLNWAFSYLLLKPQVMTRVEQELLSVTKGERPLSITDRPNTPFYNEIHRCASIVPFNLWRNTSEDVIVGPYVVPKGTAITVLISLIMTDEKYFADKYEFNPERYFNGDRLEQMVVAFGLGKRSCLGESLAQAELYLIIGNLLLRYIMSPDPLHLPSTEAQRKLGFVRECRPYHIIFQQR